MWVPTLQHLQSIKLGLLTSSLWHQRNDPKTSSWIPTELVSWSCGNLSQTPQPSHKQLLNGLQIVLPHSNLHILGKEIVDSYFLGELNWKQMQISRVSRRFCSRAGQFARSVCRGAISPISFPSIVLYHSMFEYREINTIRLNFILYFQNY